MSMEDDGRATDVRQVFYESSTSGWRVYTDGQWLRLAMDYTSMVWPRMAMDIRKTYVELRRMCVNVCRTLAN